MYPADTQAPELGGQQRRHLCKRAAILIRQPPVQQRAAGAQRVMCGIQQHSARSVRNLFGDAEKYW